MTDTARQTSTNASDLLRTAGRLGIRAERVTLHDVAGQVLAHPGAPDVLEDAELAHLRLHHDERLARMGEIVFAPDDDGARPRAPRSYCMLAPSRAWISVLSVAVVFYCDRDARGGAVTSDDVYDAWCARYSIPTLLTRPAPRQSTDQDAARVLSSACEVFCEFDPDDEVAAERARGAVVSAMARLADEFGLGEQASALRRALKEFDGRHIEGETA